jgi:hypothetical protein
LTKTGSSEAIVELYNAGGNPIKHEKDGLTRKLKERKKKHSSFNY